MILIVGLWLNVALSILAIVLELSLRISEAKDHARRQRGVEEAREMSQTREWPEQDFEAQAAALRAEGISATAICNGGGMIAFY